MGTNSNKTANQKIRQHLEIWIPTFSNFLAVPQTSQNGHGFWNSPRVLGHGSFALIDLDVHRWLVVLVVEKVWDFLVWDHRVAGDQLGHHTTHLRPVGGMWRVSKNLFYKRKPIFDIKKLHHLSISWSPHKKKKQTLFPTCLYHSYSCMEQNTS